MHLRLRKSAIGNCILLFYLLDWVDLPPVISDCCIVAGDALNVYRHSDLWQLAWKVRYAFGLDATRPIHALYFRIVTDPNAHIALWFSCDISDEASHGHACCHILGPAVRIFENQLPNR